MDSRAARVRTTQDDPEQLLTAPECVCGDKTPTVVGGGEGMGTDGGLTILQLKGNTSV